MVWHTQKQRDRKVSALPSSTFRAREAKLSALRLLSKWLNRQIGIAGFTVLFNMLEQQRWPSISVTLNCAGETHTILIDVPAMPCISNPFANTHVVFAKLASSLLHLQMCLSSLIKVLESPPNESFSIIVSFEFL